MDQHTAVIGFKGYLHPEDVERLVIPNGVLTRAEPNGDSGVRQPDGSWLAQNGDEEHLLSLDFAATTTNSEATANALKDKCINYISLFLDTPFRQARLIEVRHHSVEVAQTTHLLSITGGAFIVRPPVSNELIAKANDVLGNLEIEGSDSDSQLVYAFSQAIANVDSYRKFWDLYSLLIRLLPQDTFGDRLRLNRALMQEYPDDVPYYNDNKRQDTHLVIAIRDTLSHSDSTYNGQALDVPLNISTASDSMRRLAQKILLERFD